MRVAAIVQITLQLPRKASSTLSLNVKSFHRNCFMRGSSTRVCLAPRIGIVVLLRLLVLSIAGRFNVSNSSHCRGVSRSSLQHVSESKSSCRASPARDKSFLTMESPNHPVDPLSSIFHFRLIAGVAIDDQYSSLCKLSSVLRNHFQCCC